MTTSTTYQLRIECDELTLNLLNDEEQETFAYIPWPEYVWGDSEPDYEELTEYMQFKVREALVAGGWKLTDPAKMVAAVRTAVTPGGGFEPADVTFSVKEPEEWELRSEDFGMFTPEGNAKVNEIVTNLLEAPAFKNFSLNVLWQMAQKELFELEQENGFEEAGDTAVRDEVWSRLERAQEEKVEPNAVALVYDDANDIAEGAPQQLTTAVALGARYFYSVEDTGGSWYVLLASDKPMTPEQVQKFWDTSRTW